MSMACVHMVSVSDGRLSLSVGKMRAGGFFAIHNFAQCLGHVADLVRRVELALATVCAEVCCRENGDKGRSSLG